MRAGAVPVALAMALLVLAGCQSPPDGPTVSSSSASASASGPWAAAECPGHWHLSFDLYVNGTRVSYDHAAFTLEGRQGMPVETHLHRGSDWQWHFEPPGQERCIPLSSALAHVDTQLAADQLVLDGTHAELGQAGTFQAGGGAVLEARHRVSGAWATILIGDLVGRQPEGGERIVVAFGPPSDAEWDAWQAVADGRALQPSR